MVLSSVIVRKVEGWLGCNNEPIFRRIGTEKACDLLQLCDSNLHSLAAQLCLEDFFWLKSIGIRAVI